MGAERCWCYSLCEIREDWILRGPYSSSLWVKITKYRPRCGKSFTRGLSIYITSEWSPFLKCTLKKGMSIVHFVILPRNVFFLVLNLPCLPADFHANVSMYAFMWIFLVFYISFLSPPKCANEWWEDCRKNFGILRQSKENSEQSCRHIGSGWKNFWLSHVHTFEELESWQLDARAG